jgi:methylmalonyl-CoA/ethylmalonyl-CoA epimerase
VFSIVVRGDDADAAAKLAQRYGASTQFRQGRNGDGLELLENQLSAVFGMPLTCCPQICTDE